MSASSGTLPSLRRSLTLITIGGCLAMVYSTGVASPVRLKFFLELGAQPLHIGIMAGLGMWMWGLNFLGAAITNRLRKRKLFFLISLIGSRMLYIGVAFLPLLMPGLKRDFMLIVMIACIIAINAVGTLITPLWLSWMGDLIPKRVLNTYWGTRQGWLQLCWALSFVGIALIDRQITAPAMTVFPILVIIGVVAGVIDIVLFIWVDEPPNTSTPELRAFEPVFATLRTEEFQSLRFVRKMAKTSFMFLSAFGAMLGTAFAPFRVREFRNFLIYKCAWMGFAMFAAAFMQLYVLKQLEIDTWIVTLMWAAPGLGVFVAAKRWGRLADRFGQRPIIILCTSLKPFILIAFLLVDARTAIWVLPPVFFFDSILNSGNMVSSNGYMLKTAPKDSRPMFIAATTAFAGICGGIGAMAGGAFLEYFKDWTWCFAGRTWDNYHLLFAVDFPLRASCLFLALRIHEPQSTHPIKVFQYIRGALRLTGMQLAFPFYRKNGEDENGERPEEDGPDSSVS